jgi:DMSO reductase anchor subunit
VSEGQRPARHEKVRGQPPSGETGARSAQDTRSRVGGRRGGGERSMVPRDEPRSYYGRPIVKPPVWKPEIPWYFFAGGLGGASAALAFAASLAGNRPLERRAWGVSLVAIAASPVLLITDLGKPERFINMLRVFKPSSPMNVGAWMLSGGGAAIGASALHSILGRWPRLGRASKPVAAVSGLGIATYTAALVSHTAIPVWSEARGELPFAFAGSAASSAGGALAIITPRRYAGPARRLAVAGALMEGASTQLMERRLGDIAEPYESGAGGRYARAAKLLTTSGAALMAARGRRSRAAAAAAGALLLAGSACYRWAVFAAGFQSAEDPDQVVRTQRPEAVSSP